MSLKQVIDEIVKEIRKTGTEKKLRINNWRKMHGIPMKRAGVKKLIER